MSWSAVFVCLFLYTQQFKVVNPIPKKELLQLATDKNEGQSRRSDRGQSTPLRKCGKYPAYCLHFQDNVPYLYVMTKIFETCADILLVLGKHFFDCAQILFKVLCPSTSFTIFVNFSTHALRGRLIISV